MSCAVFSGVFLLNATIAAFAFTYLILRQEEAASHKGASIAAASANVALAPIILASLCFLKKGEAACSIFVNTFLSAIWGSATVALYVVVSDYHWQDEDARHYSVAERVTITCIPTMALLLLQLCCCCGCCSCCGGDADGGSNGLGVPWNQRTKFSDRWMRRP